jgi:hypothetical protein
MLSNGELLCQSSYSAEQKPVAALHKIPDTPKLGVRQFMGTRINFKGSIDVPNSNDLLEICRKERCDRPSLFILVDVTELMRQQPNVLAVAGTDQYGVPKSKSDHTRAEQSGGDCCLFKVLIMGHRKARHIKNADAFWTRDANTPSNGQEWLCQRTSDFHGILGLCFGPSNRCGRQNG